MKYEVQQVIGSLDSYLELDEPTIIYCYDLKHQAPHLVKEIKNRGWNILPPQGNCNKDGRWVRACIFGRSHSPITKYFKFPNGVLLVDYTGFDPQENPTLEDMKAVAEELQKYPVAKTASGVIDDMGDFSWLVKIEDIEKDNFMLLDNAFKGGATAIMPQYKDKLIDKETHIDYHQLYAYVMKNYRFPSGDAEFLPGYVESPYSIYWISGEAMARVKKDGFPILPTKDKVAGGDGDWFKVSEVLPAICDPDLKLLYENYDIVGDIIIDCSLVYHMTIKGKKVFGNMIDTIYTNRKQATVKSVKNFYKILNEVMAGYFQKTMYIGGFWRDLQKPDNYYDKVKYYSPKVGIFITAFARQLLNKNLHLAPHDKVIGFDTDAVFFAGTPEEADKYFKDQVGDEMGTVHYDAILHDVIHTAPKHYDGFDEENQPINKHSGQSQSGYSYRFDREKEEYIKEMNRDEESR